MNAQKLSPKDWFCNFENQVAMYTGDRNILAQYLSDPPESLSQNIAHEARILRKLLEGDKFANWLQVSDFLINAREACGVARVFGAEDDLGSRIENIYKDPTVQKEKKAAAAHISIALTGNIEIPALHIAQCGNHSILLAYLPSKDEEITIDNKPVLNIAAIEAVKQSDKSPSGYFMIIGKQENASPWLPFAHFFCHFRCYGSLKVSKGIGVGVKKGCTEFFKFPQTLPQPAETELQTVHQKAKEQDFRDYTPSALVFDEDGHWVGCSDANGIEVYRINDGQKRNIQSKVDDFCSISWEMGEYDSLDFDHLVKYVLDSKEHLPSSGSSNIRLRARKEPDMIFEIRRPPLKKLFSDSPNFWKDIFSGLSHYSEDTSRFTPSQILLLYCFYKSSEPGKKAKDCEVRFILMHILPDLIGKTSSAKSSLRDIQLTQWAKLFDEKQDEAAFSTTREQLRQGWGEVVFRAIQQISFGLTPTLNKDGPNVGTEAYSEHHFDFLKDIAAAPQHWLKDCKDSILVRELEAIRACIRRNNPFKHSDLCHAASLARGWEKGKPWVLLQHPETISLPIQN